MMSRFSSVPKRNDYLREQRVETVDEEQRVVMDDGR